MSTTSCSFRLTRNELKMRVVKQLTRRGISVVFPIKRSIYYVGDMPDILVHIGNEKYLALRFESDTEMVISKKGRRIRKYRLALPFSNETDALNVVLKHIKHIRENA